MEVYVYAGLSAALQTSYRMGIKNTSPEEIIQAVSKALKITEVDITGVCRKRNLVEARQICIGLILIATPITLTALGKMLNRDHSTIIYSRDTYNDLMDTDEQFRDKVSLVKSLL